MTEESALAYLPVKPPPVPVYLHSPISFCSKGSSAGDFLQDARESSVIAVNECRMNFIMRSFSFIHQTLQKSGTLQLMVYTSDLAYIVFYNVSQDCYIPISEIDMVHPLHLDNNEVLSIISNTMQVDQNATVRRVFRLYILYKTEFEDFLFTL